MTEEDLGTDGAFFPRSFGHFQLLEGRSGSAGAEATHSFRREDVPRCCPCAAMPLPAGGQVALALPPPRTGPTGAAGRGHPWREEPQGALPSPLALQTPAGGGTTAYLTATRTELSSWPADMVLGTGERRRRALPGARRAGPRSGPPGRSGGHCRGSPLTSSCGSAASSLQPF